MTDKYLLDEYIARDLFEERLRSLEFRCKQLEDAVETLKEFKQDKEGHIPEGPWVRDGS